MGLWHCFDIDWVPQTPRNTLGAPVTERTRDCGACNVERVQATSSPQFSASQSRTVPPIEQVRDDVWAVAIPMPGGHIPYSFNYLFRDTDGGLHVVDAGWDSDENWQLFVDAVESIGATIGDIRSIIITHMHPDHIGMAARMREATGAPVILHRAERDALEAPRSTSREGEILAQHLDEWGVPADRLAELLVVMGGGAPMAPVIVDRIVEDGEPIEMPGITLIPMWTPGHTNGHICLRDDQRGLLMTGDHLLPTMHAGLGLGGLSETNALADYLRGLRWVSEYTQHEILPGHGYRFTGVEKRAHQSAEHHLKRTRQVAAILAEQPDLSVWEIGSRLTWSAGWENLANFYLYSALSQTEMHRDYVLAGGEL